MPTTIHYASPSTGKQVTVEVRGAYDYVVSVEGKALGEADDLKPASIPMFAPIRHKLGNASHVLVVGRTPVGVPASAAEQIKAAQAAIESERAAALDAAVPGLALLREAAEEDARHHAQHGRWIAGDGLGRPPAPKRHDVDALAAQYPRAACYLKAEGYRDAANHHKAAAGQRAMDLLTEGGSIEEAERVLANWLPESAWTD